MPIQRQPTNRQKISQESEAACAEMSRLARSGDWLILDTETTGLAAAAEVVEIAVVDASGRLLLEQLVRPSIAVRPDAAALHGLTTADLVAEPPFPEVYPRLAALLNGRHLLAYNADFDNRLLKQTCRRYRLPFPAAEKWTCLMKLYAACSGVWAHRHGSFGFICVIR